MTLPRLAVKKPVMTGMIFLAILIFGLYSIRMLSVDLLPSIEPPLLTVLTVYPGASASDVESNVTKYIERSLASVPNLKKITSNTKENLSVVTLEFDWGTNLEEAANDSRAALEFAKVQLPSGAESPNIFKFSTEQFPVLVLGIPSPPNLDLRELKDFVDDKISNPLVRIPGVGAAQNFGAPKREMRVDFDLQKLNGMNISIESVANVLKAENVTLPSGNLDNRITSIMLRVKGEFTSPRDVENVVVGHFKEKIIYLKDVAVIKDTVTEEERRTLIDGRKGVVMLVNRLSGANTVEVSTAARKEIDRLTKELGVNIYVLFDGAEFIMLSINNLFRTLLTSIVLVTLVVFIFLRRLRGSFIIVLAIPFSLILAFFFMYLAGYTINILSLSAFAIAIGMVVDNSIVVLENVVRHIEKGERISEASVFGASEVGGALLASTLTTIAVFAPLFFLTGIAGILFTQLAAITTITISMSLFVAMFLTPMLSCKLLGIREVQKNKFLQAVYDKSEIAFDRIDEFYQAFLNWSLSNRMTVILSATILLIFSLALIPFVGTDFIPESDSSQVQVILEYPTGTSVSLTEKKTKEIHDWVRSVVPETRNIFYQAGQSSSGLGSVFGTKEGENVGIINIRLVRVKERKRSNREIADILREKLEGIPGIYKLNVLTSTSGQQAAFGGGKPVVIEIIGADLRASKQVAENYKMIMLGIKGIKEPQISLQEDKLDLIVSVQRDKAALLGLNTGMVAQTMRNYIYGTSPTDFRGTKDAYEIRLRLKESDRTNLSTVENLEIPNIFGKKIPLKSFAIIKKEFAPIQIDRKNQERVVRLEAGISGSSLGEVISELKAKIKSVPLPPGVYVEFGGSYEQQQEAFSDLFLLLLLSIVLVYIVMAAQFESFLDPFIIMFSVPFAFTGVILGLLVFGQTLSIISFIGVIMLVGIVVNNAIVLIDYMNILRAREYELKEAVLRGGRSRLRPVLMTALTTIFGLLPLALSTGDGSETWKPLGASVLGGLTVSTFVTLIIIPVFYFIFEKRIKSRISK